MTTRLQFLATLLVMLAGCLNSWGQRTPAPAASSGPISGIGAGEKNSQQQAPEPETEGEVDLSASSVKLPTIAGRPQLLTYGFRVMQVASSNTTQVGGGNSFQSVTMFSGNSALNRSWGRSNMSFSYNGAESIFAGGGFGTQLTSSHQFSFNTVLTRRRWTLGLTNASSYAPQSSFGLGLYGGLGSNPLGFSSGLRSGLYPNESVLTSGTRINNSTVAELSYHLSPLSSLRASAGFGILKFQEAAFADNSQYNLGFGFNRTLSRRSNVSVDYQFLRTASSGFEGVEAHSTLLGYTRHMTPRVTVQLSGGPQIQVRRGPITTHSLQWTSENTLLYRMEHSSLSLMYSAGIVGGSGVYQASRNHLVRVALSRPVGRYWGATLDFGYAQNKGVGTDSTSRGEHGGVMLARRVAGKGLSLSYQFQHQSLSGICNGISCSAFGGWSHSFGLGVDWMFRPVRID